MHLILISLGLAGSLVATPAQQSSPEHARQDRQAVTREYAASVLNASWQASRVADACLLRHRIPAYGEAVFSRRGAGLSFQLTLQQALLGDVAEARAEAIPAPWHHDREAIALPPLEAMSGKTPVALEGQAAEAVLLALEGGHFPVFTYDQVGVGVIRTRVLLSAMRFAPAFSAFQACERQIVAEAKPVNGAASGKLQAADEGFAGKTLVHAKTVYFTSGSKVLNKQAREVLKDLVYYLKIHPDVKVIVIDGHADAGGGAGTNLRLSLERSQAVRQYLTGNGIPPGKLRSRFFGEYLPVADGKEQDRKVNRRVHLQLLK